MPDLLIVVVMGVPGAGKTTISKLLAAALRCPLLEGDDLHPPLNVEKMHHGVALTDGRSAALARQDCRGEQPSAGNMDQALTLGRPAIGCQSSHR